MGGAMAFLTADFVRTHDAKLQTCDLRADAIVHGVVRDAVALGRHVSVL